MCKAISWRVRLSVWGINHTIIQLISWNSLIILTVYCPACKEVYQELSCLVVFYFRKIAQHRV